VVIVRALVCVLLVTVWPAAAGAQAAAPRYNPAWHGGIAAAATAGAVWVNWRTRNEVPDCNWCGVDGQGAPAVPRIDRWSRDRFKWTNEARAATISHITATASYTMPLIGLAAVNGGVRREFGRDLLAALDTIAVAQLAADISKRAIRRARPGVVFDGDPIDSGDDVHSYLSGHSTTTFAAAVGTATIASRRGSRHAKWIWLTGLGLAGTTGYLRIAADRHYLTDVLSGALVGTVTGLTIPRLFDRAPATTAAPVTAGSLTGIGPVARVGPGLRARLQLGAGAGGIGLIGAIAVP
jgi:membrane-associated phospholipid phosphatase